MKLGEFVRDYRNKYGLSQRELALKCDVSNGIISMIEKGFNPNTNEPITPTLPTLKKLADGMHISLEELLEKVENLYIKLDDEKTAINLSTDEEQLITYYRGFNSKGKERLLETAIDMSNLDRYKKHFDTEQSVG